MTDGQAAGDGLSPYPQVPIGRIYATLRDREGVLRVRLGGAGGGGLFQRDLDPEGRTIG